jgi:hypothetical protein
MIVPREKNKPHREETQIPYVGLRGWKIENGKLLSLSKRYVWSAENPIVAEHDEGIGFEMANFKLAQTLHREFVNCSCGLYAFHEMESLLENMKLEIAAASTRAATCVCIGASLHWGEVVITQKGLRSTRAQPLALLSPEDWVNGYKQTLSKDHFLVMRARQIVDPSGPMMVNARGISEDYHLPLLREEGFYAYLEEFGQREKLID